MFINSKISVCQDFAVRLTLVIFFNRIFFSHLISNRQSVWGWSREREREKAFCDWLQKTCRCCFWYIFFEHVFDQRLWLFWKNVLNLLFQEFPPRFLTFFVCPVFPCFSDSDIIRMKFRVTWVWSPSQFLSILLSLSCLCNNHWSCFVSRVCESCNRGCFCQNSKEKEIQMTKGNDVASKEKTDSH